MNQWFTAYIETYVQRDVRSLYNIGKLEEFESFIRMLAAQAGQVMNLSRFSKGLGVVVNTLKSWISILQASGIIYILYPYHANISKQLVKNPKVFFVDTGLICNLVGIESKEELKKNRIFGSIFENYCIMETIKYFNNRDNGRRKDFSFLRDQDRLEIDLIIETGQKLYPVEIKTSGKNTLKAAEGIEKLITGYKSLPVDKGYVLSPAGKLTQISIFTSSTGLEDYFKILDKLND
jgi:predicted AAA+ superfamily ATPase